MFAKVCILVLLLVVVSGEKTTRIQINNFCDQTLNIVEFMASSPSLFCTLKAGEACYKDSNLTDHYVQYQNGYDYNVTQIELSFYNPNIVFDIWSAYFDLPVSVVSDSSRKPIVCYDKNCKDDWSKKSGIQGKTQIGGSITIDYCPSQIAAFKKSELKMVKPVQNAPKMKSKFSKTRRERMEKMVREKNARL